MSFSRRYAKNRSRPLDAPPPQHGDSEQMDAEQQSTNPSPKKFSRFIGKFKEKEKQLQAEAQARRRFTHQASRLGQAAQQDEPASPIKWQGIFWSIVLIALVIFATASWRHRDQWLFPIKHIALKGEFSEVQPEALQAILHQYATGSMLLLPAERLKQQLQTLPWVEQVNIYRQWPSTLQITIEQKQVVAHFGDNQLLSASGNVFSAPVTKDLGDLPYISGPIDRAGQLWQAYQVMSDILKPYGLKIVKLDVSPRLAYSIRLNNNIELYLGSNNVLERLSIFAKVYAKNLQSKADQIQYADMRYSSGMAVGWKDAPAQAKPAAKAKKPS